MTEMPSSDAKIVVVMIVIISVIISLFHSDQTIYLYCTTLLLIFTVFYNKIGIIPTFLLNMYFQVTNIVHHDNAIGISTTMSVNGPIVMISVYFNILLIFALYYVVFKEIDYAQLFAIILALILTVFGIFLNVAALEPISLVVLALVILVDIGLPLLNVYKHSVRQAPS